MLLQISMVTLAFWSAQEAEQPLDDPVAALRNVRSERELGVALDSLAASPDQAIPILPQILSYLCRYNVQTQAHAVLDSVPGESIRTAVSLLATPTRHDCIPEFLARWWRIDPNQLRPHMPGILDGIRNRLASSDEAIRESAMHLAFTLGPEARPVVPVAIDAVLANQMHDIRALLQATDYSDWMALFAQFENARVPKHTVWHLVKLMPDAPPESILPEMLAMMHRTPEAPWIPAAIRRMDLSVPALMTILDEDLPRLHYIASQKLAAKGAAAVPALPAMMRAANNNELPAVYSEASKIRRAYREVARAAARDGDTKAQEFLAMVESISFRAPIDGDDATIAAWAARAIEMRRMGLLQRSQEGLLDNALRRLGPPAHRLVIAEVEQRPSVRNIQLIGMIYSHPDCLPSPLPDAEQTPIPDGVRPLLERLEQSPDKRIRYAASGALLTMCVPTEISTQRIARGRDRGYPHHLRALILHAPNEAEKSLRDLMQSVDQRQRSEVARCLPFLGAARALPDLLVLLQDTSPVVTEQALQSLMQFEQPDPRILQGALFGLRHKQEQVRKQAIRLVTSLNTANVTPGLAPLCDAFVELPTFEEEAAVLRVFVKQRDAGVDCLVRVLPDCRAAQIVEVLETLRVSREAAKKLAPTLRRLTNHSNRVVQIRARAWLSRFEAGTGE